MATSQIIRLATTAETSAAERFALTLLQELLEGNIAKHLEPAALEDLAKTLLARLAVPLSAVDLLEALQLVVEAIKFGAAPQLLRARMAKFGADAKDSRSFDGLRVSEHTLIDVRDRLILHQGMVAERLDSERALQNAKRLRDVGRGRP
jgi:hypothetical protein